MKKNSIIIIGASIGCMALVAIMSSVFGGEDLATLASQKLQESDQLLQESHDLFCENYHRTKADCMSTKECEDFQAAQEALHVNFNENAHDACEPPLQNKETEIATPEGGEPVPQYIEPSSDSGNPLFFGDEAGNG